MRNLPEGERPPSASSSSSLSPAQIATYLDAGVLVVPDVLSPDDVDEARRGLEATLLDECGVDANDLDGTGRGLVDASSTDGAGGVLDVFYPPWKAKVAANQTLFSATRQLWRAAHCHEGERLEDLDEDERFRWHPYGGFDCDRGYMYIDRIGYRIPTDVAERIGKQLVKERGEDTPEEGTKKKKKKRARPIQRSLTPHLDCCPETYDDVEGKVKWRPIQCFVSLTDNLEPNTGGFEAVPGFHREFRSWARDGRRRRRRPGSPSRGDGSSATSRPLPCVGEYAHLSPSDDGEIMRRTEHVPVRAGSAVFWDNRIPHANAYRNDGREARAVVYCSFLPDIPVNRTFVERQLEDWRAGRVPRLGDRWMRREDEDERDDEGRGDGSGKEASKATISELSELGKRLIGLVEWP